VAFVIFDTLIVIYIYYRVQTGTSLTAYGQAYRQPAGRAGLKSVKPGYPGLEAVKPGFTGLQNRPRVCIPYLRRSASTALASNLNKDSVSFVSADASHPP